MAEKRQEDNPPERDDALKGDDEGLGDRVRSWKEKEKVVGGS